MLVLWPACSHWITMYLWIIQIVKYIYMSNSHFGLQEPYVGVCLCCVFYLKGSQTELDEDSGLCPRVFWQECKYHVVHPKQRDEEQSGLGQPPAHSVKTDPWRRNFCRLFVRVSMCLCMSSRVHEYLFLLEVTGVIATNAWRSQLLDQNADHIDEDDEVHLHQNKWRAVKMCTDGISVHILCNNCSQLYLFNGNQTLTQNNTLLSILKSKSGQKFVFFLFLHFCVWASVCRMIYVQSLILEGCFTIQCSMCTFLGGSMKIKF